MAILDEKDFKELANHKAEVSVSIFIPTQRAGQEVMNEKNRKHLNSQWDEVRKKLKNEEVKDSVIEAIGKPIEELIEDREFWRHQSDGLAVFASEEFFQHFTLPVNFEAYNYISEEFYVKPLIPALTGDGKFYVLSLQLEDVKLFEATKHSITPIEIDDLTPSRLEERVGFDYKDKSLQFRTQAEGGDKTQFHGHGDSEGDTKKEIKQFFRAVNDGISDYLNKEKLPLVVYCQDYLFPIYKDANTYNHLHDEAIAGNPNDTDLIGMHSKAIDVIEPVLNKKRESKIKKYEEVKSTESTSSAISDIIPAIFQGQIDTLFIENRAEVWGTYDETNMKVDFSEEEKSHNKSLLNLAAKKTLEMGGNVFLVEHEFMPNKKSKMNALFRY